MLQSIQLIPTTSFVRLTLFWLLNVAQKDTVILEN